MRDALVSLLVGCVVVAFPVATKAQTEKPPEAPNVHVVYMGGDDCPPCVAWRRTELPKLQAAPVFERIKFSYVIKVIRSPVPPSFFLPADVKPLKEKLDYASNGTTGSPHSAILVNGEVYDYFYGTRSAAQWEQMLVAIERGEASPLPRCLRLTRQRSCERRPE